MKQMSGLTDMCGEIFPEKIGLHCKVVRGFAGTPQAVPKDTSNGNAGIGCGKMAAVRPDTGTGVGTYYSGPCES